MSAEKPRDAAAYIRVSTGEQTEFSPESQLDRIREYASAHGYRILSSNIFTDSGISGKSTLKRAAFQAMINKAKEYPRPFESILVWKFSRFARNREDSIMYKSMLRKKYGINVISVSEDIGGDKLSLLIEAMIEAMDEFYSLNLGEEVKRGMKKRAEKGKFQSRPPFGYSLIGGELVPDSLNQEYVRLIFSQFLSGRDPAEIRDFLNYTGIKTANNNPWTTRSVLYILKNPLYAGYVFWNKRSENPVLKKGNHLPLIDDDSFKKASKLLGSKEGRKNKDSDKHIDVSEKPFYLELLRCSSCKGRFCLCGDRKNLQCINYIKKKCSVSHSVSVEKMNSTLENALLEVFGDKCRISTENSGDCCEKTDRQKINANDTEDSTNTNYLQNIEAQNDIERLLSAAEKRYNRVKTAYNNGIYTIEELKEAFSAVERIRTKLTDCGTEDNTAYGPCDCKFSGISNCSTEEKRENSKSKNNKKENPAALALLSPSSEGAYICKSEVKTSINIIDMLFHSDRLTRGEKLALLSSAVEKIVFHRPEEELELFFY